MPVFLFFRDVFLKKNLPSGLFIYRILPLSSIEFLFFLRLMLDLINNLISKLPRNCL